MDYVISRWKNYDEKGEKRATLPMNPEGTNGLIAATTGGKATEAGLEVLKEGGSAVDAAIATALCEQDSSSQPPACFNSSHYAISSALETQGDPTLS